MWNKSTKTTAGLCNQSLTFKKKNFFLHALPPGAAGATSLSRRSDGGKPPGRRSDGMMSPLQACSSQMAAGQSSAVQRWNTYTVSDVAQQHLDDPFHVTLVKKSGWSDIRLAYTGKGPANEQWGGRFGEGQLSWWGQFFFKELISVFSMLCFQRAAEAPQISSCREPTATLQHY